MALHNFEPSVFPSPPAVESVSWEEGSLIHKICTKEMVAWKLFQICARHPGANSTKPGAQTKLSAAVYADVKPINLGRKTNRCQHPEKKKVVRNVQHILKGGRGGRRGE